ncbi:hypothetical protein PMAYCL1PPCAC_00820, partial [Pristionchus mayeri]
DRCMDILSLFSSWESLPWSALNRTLSFLHTNKECIDLANLSKVSTHFNYVVKEFMGYARNRPGLKRIDLSRFQDGLMLQVCLFPANIPFYDLTTLDWSRFKRSILSYSKTCALEVELRGADDLALKQVQGLLSAPVQRVLVEELDGCLSASEFALFTDVLQHLTSISSSMLINVVLDDETAPSILSIASRTTKKFKLNSNDRENPHQVLSYPVAFFNQLDCQEVSLLWWSNYYSDVDLFFGLPYTFWEEFLNEKFKKRSIKYCEIVRYDEEGDEIVEKMRNVPITFPDDVIELIGWVK